MAAGHGSDPPLFVSLGMLVLDELQMPDGSVKHDVVGGSGAYSSLGARLAVENEQSRRVASFVLAGEDFPREKVQQQLQVWGVDYVIEDAPAKRSTRGRLRYHDWRFEHKSYEYLSKPLQPRPNDLPLPFLRSSAFHLLSSPDYLSTQVSELVQRRIEYGITAQPLLVWEPAPLSCTADFLDAHIHAACLVDVFSPNHVELLSLCGQSSKNQDFQRDVVEGQAARFLPAHHLKPKICIIRCGEHGALILERSQSGSLGFTISWLRPFFSSDRANRVVDATGGGNTFLGAFAVEYQLNGRSADLAACKASVAASFALEQIGPPVFEDGRWNGVTVDERVGEYLGM